MLILSRKIGQSIILGEDIFLTVLGVRGGQVRLGIDAPETMKILREEISSKIYEEQKRLDVNRMPVTPKITIRKKPKMIIPQNTAH